MRASEASDQVVASPKQGENQVPDVLSTEPISPLALAQRAARYQAELRDELRPTGALAAILVTQLGRHAAGLDLGAASEAATIRFASTNPAAATLYQSADDTERPFLAAMGSDLVAAASRYQSRHERAFFAALRELRAVARAPQQLMQLNLFADEESCIAYLAGVQEERHWRCAKCNSTTRYFLPMSARFECTCGQQFSVRHGTIFARSKVPLVAWFGTVQILLADPSIPVAELAQRVTIVRHATLRKMRSKVLEALSSLNAETLLAGLPSYVTSNLRLMSEKRETTLRPR